MHHHSESVIRLDRCTQLEPSLIFLHGRENQRGKLGEKKLHLFQRLVLFNKCIHLWKLLLYEAKYLRIRWLQFMFYSHFFLTLILFKFSSIKLRAAHLVCLFFSLLVLSLLPHLSVMLLDTTESTSELGWTTYPDTGVSVDLAVNVLSSCWSAKAVMMDIQLTFNWMCCTNVTHDNVLRGRWPIVRLWDVTVVRD